MSDQEHRRLIKSIAHNLERIADAMEQANDREEDTANRIRAIAGLPGEDRVPPGSRLQVPTDPTTEDAPATDEPVNPPRYPDVPLRPGRQRMVEVDGKLFPESYFT